MVLSNSGGLLDNLSGVKSKKKYLNGGIPKIIIIGTGLDVTINQNIPVITESQHIPKAITLKRREPEKLPSSFELIR